MPSLHGCTPLEVITGNTPDVSEYLEFKWYDLVWYFELTTFPEENKLLARWIGIAHRIGQAMCYWLLPSSGIPIAQTTIQLITPQELATKSFIALEPTPLQLYRQDEDIESDSDSPFELEALAPEEDDIETDCYDELLLTGPLLEQDGKLERATITGRKRDTNGNLVDNFNANPLLNTRVYIATFPDEHMLQNIAQILLLMQYIIVLTMMDLKHSLGTNPIGMPYKQRQRDSPPKAGTYVSPGKIGQHLSIH